MVRNAVKIEVQCDAGSGEKIYVCTQCSWRLVVTEEQLRACGDTEATNLALEHVSTCACDSKEGWRQMFRGGMKL